MCLCVWVEQQPHLTSTSNAPFTRGRTNPYCSSYTSDDRSFSSFYDCFFWQKHPKMRIMNELKWQSMTSFIFQLACRVIGLWFRRRLLDTSSRVWIRGMHLWLFEVISMRLWKNSVSLSFSSQLSAANSVPLISANTVFAPHYDEFWRLFLKFASTFGPYTDLYHTCVNLPWLSVFLSQFTTWVIKSQARRGVWHRVSRAPPDY